MLAPMTPAPAMTIVTLGNRQARLACAHASSLAARVRLSTGVLRLRSSAATAAAGPTLTSGRRGGDVADGDAAHAAAVALRSPCGARERARRGSRAVRAEPGQRRRDHLGWPATRIPGPLPR